MSQVRRYHNVARKLSTLPPELVHEVFSDLPLSKVLELISAHELPYLETCVLTHIHLGKIFTSEVSLTKVKEYFTIYVQLCERRHGRKSNPYPNIPSLQYDAYSYTLKHSDTSRYNILLVDVQSAVYSMLDVYTEYLPLLSRVSTEPIPGRQHWDLSDSASLLQVWETIARAEASLNAVKSKHLLKVAEILAKYPGMLRSFRDGSQEHRTHSLQHRIELFERLAKYMKRPQILGGLFVAKCWFSQHRFPLVPHNRYLAAFLKVLEKFPLQPDPKRSNYIYPTEVAKTIIIATQGMATINMKESVEGRLDSYSQNALMRTKYTAYSSPNFKRPGGLCQPRFTDYRDDVDTKDKGIPLTANDLISPFHEGEFQWLEAFLESCRFMQGMSDVEWKPGMSVKVYWGLHTGESATLPGVL